MVRHSQMRRGIAAHMVHSVATAPHVTTVFDADLTKVIRHRELNRAEAEARGFKLTYTAYFVQATVKALQAVPEVNSRWHDDALELFDDCNIGVGTALENGGLIVPVIPQAQTLDLLQTADRLGDLTTRARGGKLTPADVQHGTFTISNHGVSGSIIATPIIINQPQSAILGVGRMEKRVIVAEAYGHVMTEIRPMIYVTLTIDHRVLDGFQANQFLTEWVRAIEDWGGGT
ncbi:MAG: 2-oxo acid dehydrogenase subunit E2 [Gemmatimonadales bacterium]